ncbi:MAG: hypothetical protein IKQ37_10750 [Bacteroidaceae bacterium]|nr:hypothetical protein [Bacteroidaceae bacterium]
MSRRILLYILFTFSLFQLFSFSSAFAQQMRPSPALAPMRADAHGIITEQPEGELRHYNRSGGATYAPIYFIAEQQDGISAEVVFSPDGTKAYFKNIISHAATGSWVEGTVSGNTISIALGQTVYWFDNGNYGMQLARVKVNGTITDYTVTTQGKITFTIDGDDLILNNTSGDPDNNIFDGIGLVYTTPYAGEWSYYLDYGTVLTFKDVSVVTPPDDLQPVTYSMEYENSGHLVGVGFDGDDVYVQGVSQSYIPRAWMKGRIDGDRLTFPLQFGGSLSTYLLYFCGADEEYKLTDTGYYDWVYNWTDGSTTFDYDAATQSFKTNQALLVNNSDEAIDRAEKFHAPLFRPFVEQPATPADPSISGFIDMYFESTGFNIVMLNVPLKDTEGRFLDPSKVSYQLYFDDDEPFTLYPDEYRYLTEPVDEIPYLFTTAAMSEAFSRSNIYEKAYAIYLYETGFDRFGVQTIYRGGGEERRSNISYHYFTGDGIASPKSSPEGKDFNSPLLRKGEAYDLSGRKLPNNQKHKGLVITRTADGRVIKQVK